jgi:hypothetical protein
VMGAEFGELGVPNEANVIAASHFH